jgi:hypothetical protein
MWILFYLTLGPVGRTQQLKIIPTSPQPENNVINLVKEFNIKYGTTIRSNNMY